MSAGLTKTLTAGLAAAVLTTALTAAPAEARYGRKRAVAAGVLGGLALGALAAGAANAGPRYYRGDCWIERQPVYDDWGDIVRYRRVRICN
jgi:MFS family permease